MTYPANGTPVQGTNAKYNVKNIQDVIDRFNRRKGAVVGADGKFISTANHPTYIAWFAQAAGFAKKHADQVSTLEIPATATRPEIVILGNFDTASDRTAAEYLATVLSSNDPTIVGILAKYAQPTTAVVGGQTVQVQPQSIYIALADLNINASSGIILGAGDLYSANDAEFEIVMNKGAFTASGPSGTDYDRARFLYVLVHELGHRTGGHPLFDWNPKTTPINSLQDIENWGKAPDGSQWTVASITDPKAGFRKADPYYSDAIADWKKLVVSQHLNINATQQADIVGSNDAAYNLDAANRYRHNKFLMFVELSKKPGAPGLTPQVIDDYVAQGIIARNKKASPTSYNPADFVEGKESREAAAARRKLGEKNAKRSNKQLEKLKKILGEYYDDLGLDKKTKDARLAEIALLFGQLSPDDEDKQEARQRVLDDIEAARIDQAAILQLKQDAEIGSVIGSVIGQFIGGNNVLLSAGSSALFSTIGQNMVELIVNGGPIIALPSGGTATIFDNIGSDLLGDLKGEAIGVVSSFITAELVKTLGISGFAGELANSVGGKVINQILTNLTTLGDTYVVVQDGVEVVKSVGVLTNVGPQLVLTAAASFLASKLSSAIYQPQNIGGQVGAALGAAISSYIHGPMLIAAFATANPAVIGTALAIYVIDTVILTVLGSLIGSVFGGTPVAGADSVYDPESRQFVTANVYSKHGGSKANASSIADTVNTIYNGILAATGGDLVDPTKVQSGNYGVRGNKFVYRPTSSRDKDAITQSFKGKTAGEDLIKYGSFAGLTDPDFKIAGGNIFAKRGFSGSLGLIGNWHDFDPGALLFDIKIAGDYGEYLNSKDEIDLLIGISPTSAFSMGWLQTLARADELGVSRRNASDWVGGFGYFLESLANMPAGNVSLNLIPSYQDNLERTFAFYDGDGAMLALANDTVDARRIDSIKAGAAADVIDLRTGKLADQIGYTVNGHLNDDIALSGSDFTSQSGTMVSFAAGDLRKSVTVAVANDGVAEATEKFLGQLSGSTGLSIIGGAAEAIVIDGAAAKPTLVVGRSYALEGEGYAVFRVTLSKAATGAVTASLATAALVAAAADFGADIEVSADGLTGWTSATSLSFAAGQTQQFVRVAVVADNGVDGQGNPTNVEGAESFTLTATVTAGASLIANVADPAGVVAAAGTGTIIDSSMASNPLAWIDSVTVDEASGQAVFSIARSSSGTAASLKFSTADRKELKIDIAATVDAGDGDDIVHASDRGDNVIGGGGNDTLYGGRLDDWLLGGDGNDTLNAGSASSGTLGGDGNYLSGDAGDDLLIGREGSDWLEGGDGTDTLEGGDGGDILSGGAGHGDILRGGRGDDQYIFRIGDVGSTDVAHADIVRDESGLTVGSSRVDLQACKLEYSIVSPK